MKRKEKSDQQFRRLLEHICAYCGYSKSTRPPVWCVREHEVYTANNLKRLAEVRDASR